MLVMRDLVAFDESFLSRTTSAYLGALFGDEWRSLSEF
jgi:hypothetical protein